MQKQDQLKLLDLLHKSIFTLDENFFAAGNPVKVQGTLGGTAKPRLFRDSTTGKPALRGFDFNLQGKGKILTFRFIEQNKNKSSQYASMARNGAQIAWLIDTSIENGFLGRYQSSPESGNKGHWYPSRPRAITPKTSVSQAIQSEYGPPSSNDDVDIPEMIDDMPEIPAGTYDVSDQAAAMMAADVEEPPDMWEMGDGY